MLKTCDLYLDLGTANTLVYARGRGFVLNEPSVVALKRTTANGLQTFGVGHRAKAMMGRNPENVSILHPLKEGVIADFENTSRMVRDFVSKIKQNMFFWRPRMLISLPYKVTPFERNAVKELGFGLGAKQVDLLDEPMAAALGAGLSVLDPKGQMIVDLGGGTTEIAVISLGGIVVSSAVRIGGDHLDVAIRTHLRNHYNFSVGEATAEFLKIHAGAALASYQRGVEVGGYDFNLGLPRKRRIDTAMIFKPIDHILREILAMVHETLEKTPPEIAGDLARSGIVLSGGLSLLPGLAERFEQELGIRVHMAKDPLLSVARGGALALEDGKLFKGLECPA